MPASAELRYRAGRRGDAWAIAALHADNWQRHYRGAFSDTFLDHHAAGYLLPLWTARLATPDPQARTIVAEDNDTVVGLAHTILGQDRPRGAFLDNLHVAHGRKRQRIGTRLLALTAQADLDTSPSSGLYLWVLELARAQHVIDLDPANCSITAPDQAQADEMSKQGGLIQAKGTAVTYEPPLWPVSVKGVALDGGGRVVLLKNERQEWELPGGRLEIGNGAGRQVPDDSPEQAVEREILEETGWQVTAGSLVPGGIWIYEPSPGARVLIVTYGCTVLDPDRPPVVSHEHSQLGLFAADEIGGLNMPRGYKNSIAAWYGRT